jgi:alpha-beta hydrolase superfamily lysophospholipase
MTKVMRSASSLEYAPIEHENWWREFVKYSKFNRQGLDIVCASFEPPHPLGCIVIVTDWNETFLKYADLIRNLYLHNYSVYTYDHQSQGLSGRWLVEPQLTWIHTFDDYVDDFVFYLTTVARQNSSRPIFVIAHSMGCLISAIGMSRHPTIVSRAVFSAPLIRNKCGMKYFDYKYPLPQQLVYWITVLACAVGLGSRPALGFIKERPSDKIKIKLTTDRLSLVCLYHAVMPPFPSLPCQ